MEEEKSRQSLEDIIAQYPPRVEIFREGEGVIVSKVSKDENGRIFYVVPGTTTLPKEETFEEGKGKVVARVSRNEEGKIIYKVPGTTKLVGQ